MDDKLFHELETNLKEAVKVAKGTSAPKSVYIVLTPAEIRAIRNSVNMSQAAFARTLQLSVDTIKGWGQGKRGLGRIVRGMLRADGPGVSRCPLCGRAREGSCPDAGRARVRYRSGRIPA